MLRAHIGSYVNANSVFEAVTNGMNVADLTNQKRLPEPIETGRWYDIRLEVGYDKVDCFLDGKLLMSYEEPTKFFAISGRDNKTGDIIIKVVNASDQPHNTAISVDGAQLSAEAEWITLAADSPEAENSFTAPEKYIPVKSVLRVTGHEHTMEFKPWSISVLRFRDKAWKRVSNQTSMK
jgi:alpha-L-arabinofuranosidase